MGATEDLAGVLRNASDVFAQKNAKEQQIEALQAEIVLLDEQIVGLAAKIAPVAAALQQYAQEVAAASPTEASPA